MLSKAKELKQSVVNQDSRLFFRILCGMGKYVLWSFIRSACEDGNPAEMYVSSRMFSNAIMLLSRKVNRG